MGVAVVILTEGADDVSRGTGSLGGFLLTLMAPKLKEDSFLVGLGCVRGAAR